MSEPNDVSDEPIKPVKESLLDKYRIPLDHFELDYINKCTNSKELEKILKVLRSGEEGHFPHLIKAAEEALRAIKPKSKLLRTTVSVVDKSQLDEAERMGITQDLNEWLQHVSVSDQELKTSKTKYSKSTTEIRRSAKVTTDNEREENKEKRICSTDYAAWDKYDPDTEIVKMDLDEEKKIKAAMKKSKKRIENSRNFNNITTEARKNHFSNQEREKGNECFKIKEYEEALHYYTNSITIKENVNNLNNRAATYLKLARYQEALEDCQKVLNIDNNNIKAHLRMAEALEKLEDYEKALDVIQFAICANPNDDWAQKFAERVREKCNQQSQTTRLTITEIE